MSISDNYVPVKELGDGSTVEFSGNWNMIASSYARVYLESVATGVQTLQTLDTDYTLTFDSSGFVVDFTLSGAPTSANFVVIGREVALDQTNPYKTSKGYQGIVLENSLDKLTAITQDLQDQVNRSPKTPIGSGSITLSTYSAGTIPYWSVSTSNTFVNSTKTMAEVEGAVDAVAALTAASGVKVSANDTTVGFLNGKLVAGAGLGFTENNDGSSETLTVALANMAQATIKGRQAGSGTGVPEDLTAAQARTIISLAPTRQYLTTGTGATYTTPADCKAILVKMVGGGGGGCARTTNAGSAGGATIFNSIEAAGGSGGPAASGTLAQPGAGGTGGAGSATRRIRGNAGQASVYVGAAGGVGPFGGGSGRSGGPSANSEDAAANSGAGGTGATTNSSVVFSHGGGAGEYAELYIASPAASYTYTIGAAGAGGAAGGNTGGDGGSGLIIVEEYY